MEGSSMTWAIALASLAAGLGLGALLARPLLLKKHQEKASSLQQQLDDLQNQQREYRQKVDQHFNQSAELFVEMTDNYRKVYQHLSQGAQSLCENPPKRLASALEGSHLIETGDETAQLAHQPDEFKTDEPIISKEATSDPEVRVKKPIPPTNLSDTETEMDNTEAPHTSQREPSTLH